MRKEVFVIDLKDNVATLVSESGKAGLSVDVPVNGGTKKITLRQDVPYCHKFAISPIPKGTQILKYGFSIGTATADIQPGDYVHVHNLESNRGRGDLAAKVETAR